MQINTPTQGRKEEKDKVTASSKKHSAGASCQVWRVNQKKEWVREGQGCVPGELRDTTHVEISGSIRETLKANAELVSTCSYQPYPGCARHRWETQVHCVKKYWLKEVTHFKTQRERTPFVSLLILAFHSTFYLFFQACAIFHIIIPVWLKYLLPITQPLGLT